MDAKNVAIVLNQCLCPTIVQGKSKEEIVKNANTNVPIFEYLIKNIDVNFTFNNETGNFEIK